MFSSTKLNLLHTRSLPYIRHHMYPHTHTRTHAHGCTGFMCCCCGPIAAEACSPARAGSRRSGVGLAPGPHALPMPAAALILYVGSPYCLSRKSYCPTRPDARYRFAAVIVIGRACGICGMHGRGRLRLQRRLHWRRLQMRRAMERTRVPSAEPKGCSTRTARKLNVELGWLGTAW
jgi:hypothetical protein